jgi:chromosome partitioning protein
MAAKIITIAQHKGGAGKTTLTAQIAACLHQNGERVCILDVDPQGSLSEWFKAREITLGRKNKMVHHQMQGWKLMRELDHLRRDFDFILIDTPPHAESESSIAVRQADLVIIPIQPSPLDIWASAPTLKLVIQEKGHLMLVLNRVPAKSKLNETILEKLRSMKITVARQTLGNRVAYASSILQGLGVVESEPKGLAAQEMQTLVQDIQKSKILTLKKSAA